MRERETDRERSTPENRIEGKVHMSGKSGRAKQHTRWRTWKIQRSSDDTERRRERARCNVRGFGFLRSY